MQILVNNDADINIVDSNAGWSLLHLATRDRNIDCLRYLINEGIKVDIIDFFGETALFSAVKGDSEEAVNILLSTNLSLFRKNNLGVSLKLQN